MITSEEKEALRRKRISDRVRVAMQNRRAAGLPIGRPRKTDYGVIAQHAAAGVPLSHIGRLVGCSSSTVCAALKAVREAQPCT